MCQILFKPAGYALRKDLLQSTCIVNSDGFGLMTQEDGQLAIAKYYNGDNDPEEIGEALQEVYDRDCFLHFRYRTKGPVNSESCHPFIIYDDNDRQLALMHNGTFSGYGTTDKVDSEDFGEKIIAPLYDTFLKSGERDPLNNRFFSQIVHKFTDTGSKVVLMDNLNKPLIVNEKSGEIFTDQVAGKSFWISNKYSFNQSHRLPATTVRGWAGSYSGSFWEGGDQSDNGLPSSNTTMGTKPVDTKAPKEEVTVPARVERDTYWGDVLGLDNIDGVLDMTFGDVSDLVDLEPENAKLFINDLLWELYAATYETSEVPDEEEKRKDFDIEKLREEERKKAADDLKAALDGGEHVYPSVETH